MQTINTEYLAKVCDTFLNFCTVQEKPQIRFTARPDLNECVVEDGIINAITFNTTFIEKLDPTYGLLVMTHDLYHQTVQGIDSKRHVIDMKDKGRWDWMQLYDVEADLKVVQFFKIRGVFRTFNEYQRCIYGGISTYHDDWIRSCKLERFIGTAVSTRRLFQNNHTIVYLPQLNYKSTLFFSTDFDRQHLGYQNIVFTPTETFQWERAFQEATLLSEDAYVDLMDTLTNNLLYKIAKLSRI